MKTVKWMDVYDMMMEKKKEVEADRQRVRSLYAKGEVDQEIYLHHRNRCGVKLQTINEILSSFDDLPNE